MGTISDPYLPTVTEIEKMSEYEFSIWTNGAIYDLRKRKEERDPLFYLRKRISNVLNNNELTEVQRESDILHELERYERLTMEPQRQK